MEEMFNDKTQLVKVKDDRVFIDRKGEVFEHIIDYLRTEGMYIPNFAGNQNMQKMFDIETKYWGIDPEKILRRNLPPQIIDLLNSVPIVNQMKTMVPLKKWHQLDHLDFVELHKNSPIDFDSSLVFGEYRSNIAHYIGQVNSEGRAHGLGRWVSSEVDNHIYEG